MKARKKAALVVEDSPTQAVALRLRLEEAGLQVYHAPNGRVGVEMAKQYDPDVIILNLEMPEMDGFEACKRLKASTQTSHIPVVLFSVHGDRAVVVIKGIDLGAVDFIPKDAFAYAVLLETLRQLEILEPLSSDNQTQVLGDA